MRMWSLVGLLLATTSASAHQQWSNGKPIPDWVKQVCCADDEGHQIDARRMHLVRGRDPMMPRERPNSASQRNDAMGQ